MSKKKFTGYTNLNTILFSMKYLTFSLIIKSYLFIKVIKVAKQIVVFLSCISLLNFTKNLKSVLKLNVCYKKR